jgi:Eukaryotic phosphomannomutase
MSFGGEQPSGLLVVLTLSRYPSNCPWLEAMVRFLDVTCNQSNSHAKVVEAFNYVFAENGLTAYKTGKQLASQSFIKYIGEILL